MEYYNKNICVTVDDLTRIHKGNMVMTEANINKLATRNRIVVANRGGGLGKYSLIVYSSLPSRFQNRFEEIYGKPEEVLKKEKENMEKELILTIDLAARKVYTEHILPNGKHLKNDQIEEYTINASVLAELQRALNKRMATNKALGGIPKDLWEKGLTFIESYRAKYEHTLPQTVKGLRTKMGIFKRDGYTSLISGKVGNENTLKITEEAGNQIIALKRSMVPVYTNAQIFDEFNRIAGTKGWKQLKSMNSLVQFLERPEVKPLWYDAVHGELAAHQKYTRKHKTKLPSLRDALWYADGTKLNLFYKAFDKDGKLIVCTTQVYEVMDAYSETLLGYHISDHENSEAQYNAFRMAIETAKHKPYEVVTDNQGGHKKLKNQQFFEKIKSHVFRFTAPHSGQSKTIENAFGRLQAQVLHKDWRFTGQNITATSENSRPNMEFVNANKEKLYTLAELKVAYAKAREEWNNLKHPSTSVPRMEMYSTSINPETPEVDELDMMELFWQTTEKPSTFTASGITIEVDGTKYTYEVLGADGMPDLEFRSKNTFRKFYTRYDQKDMAQVRLYTQDADGGMRYAATANPYIEVHRAIQEQGEGEMGFIHEMDTRNKRERVKRQVAAAELETEHGVAPEQHGLNRPRMIGLSAKDMETMMDAIVHQAGGKKTKRKRIREPEPEEELELALELHEEFVDVGRRGKHLSNVTYNEIDRLEKY